MAPGRRARADPLRVRPGPHSLVAERRMTRPTLSRTRPASSTGRAAKPVNGRLLAGVACSSWRAGCTADGGVWVSAGSTCDGCCVSGLLCGLFYFCSPRTLDSGDGVLVTAGAAGAVVAGCCAGVVGWVDGGVLVDVGVGVGVDVDVDVGVGVGVGPYCPVDAWLLSARPLTARPAP